jgi:hypothetical protein
VPLSNWNSVKEITNWEGGTVRNELEWRTSSERKLRATALQAVICYFVIGSLQERLFFGTVPALQLSQNNLRSLTPIPYGNWAFRRNWSDSSCLCRFHRSVRVMTAVTCLTHFGIGDRLLHLRSLSCVSCIGPPCRDEFEQPFQRLQPRGNIEK